MYKKNTANIILTISTLIIIAIFLNRGHILLNSEVVPAKIISCDSKWVEIDRGLRDDEETVQYIPVAVTASGEKAIGSVMMPTRAICSQQIGKEVSMLVNFDNQSENKIYSFVQFWSLALLAAFIPIALILGIYSVTLTRIFAFLFYVIGIYAVCSEVGIIEKYFPKFATGIDVSQSEAALSRCVKTSLAKENVTDRSLIKKLVCQDEEINTLESISDLTGLEGLYLQGNTLTSLNGLKPLVNLKRLSIAGNKTLTSTKGIEYATNLVELQANKTPISDLFGMDKLLKIEVIAFMQSNISDVSVFKNTTSLLEITLSYNKISDISAFSKSINLSKVSISNNNILDVSTFKNMNNLNWLTAYSNNISDISSLYQNKNIMTFGVNGIVPCEQFHKLSENISSEARIFLPKRCE
jgi:hypothetical protein